MVTAAEVEKATRRWCEEFVIGLGLCPFARAPFEAGTLRIAVCAGSEPDELRIAVLEELERLQVAAESSIATTLLVFSQALSRFEDYLDMVGEAEELVKQSGLQGLVQVASFHPDYCFAGERPDAPGQYSNRSPFPCIHLLREAMVTRSVESHPAPERIPADNIRHLESIGQRELARRWRRLLPVAGAAGGASVVENGYERGGDDPSRAR